MKAVLFGTKLGLGVLACLFLANHFEVISLDNLAKSLSKSQTKEVVEGTSVNDYATKIKSVSELTTILFTSEVTIKTSAQRKVLNLNAGSTKLIYVAKGTVRLGVDFSSITADSIQISELDKSITVKLPKSKILDTKLDTAGSKVFDYNEGFLGLGPDSGFSLVETAEAEAIKRLNDLAKSSGSFDEADKKAKEVVSGILALDGYTVKFL